MQCDVCGTEVRLEHKFCMECGARLADQPHFAAAVAAAAGTPPALERGRRAPGPAHPMFDPQTGQLLAIGPGTRPPRRYDDDIDAPDDIDDIDEPDDIDEIDDPGDERGPVDALGAGGRMDEVAAEDLATDDPGVVDDADLDAPDGAGADAPPVPPPLDPDATKVLPALGQPETTFAPPDPTPGAGLPWSAVVDTSAGRPPVPPPPPRGHAPPAAAAPAAHAAEEYPPWPGATGGYVGDADLYGSYDVEAERPTRVQYVADPAPGPPRYVPDAPVTAPGYEPTGVLPATYQPWEDDDVPYVTERRGFRVRPLLVVAVLAAAAAVAAVVLPVVAITSPGAPAELTGEWKVNDFATNFAVAGILTAVTLVAGAVIWCFGSRWGAGLAGGAGAGLAGWAVLPLGAAEVQLAESDAALGASAELTRDLGYWCLVGAGGVGLVVLLLSLLRARDDGRPGLDPWVAALGAIAAVVAAIGPLIPLNGVDLSLNWSSAPDTDLPSAFFAARLANLAVGLLCGVFGFLLVRRYGLGLALGAAVCNGWLVLTSATGQTANPLGPAYYNPGAEPNADGLIEPYMVTIAGVSLVFFFGVVAVAMALLDSD